MPSPFYQRKIPDASNRIGDFKYKIKTEPLAVSSVVSSRGNSLRFPAGCSRFKERIDMDAALHKLL